jgi:hypothetical protein
MIGKNAIEALIRFGASSKNTGCAVTSFVAVLLLVIGLRLLPAHRSNARLIDAAGAIAAGASSASEEDVQERIRAVARSLDIPEALEPHAIRVARAARRTVEGGSQIGMCTVRIKYTRRISIYGIAKISLTTDREIAKAFVATDNGRLNRLQSSDVIE